MRAPTRVALAGLMGLLTLTLTLTAQPPAPPQGKLPVEKLVATATKLKEADIVRTLAALGPAVSLKLRAGEVVTLPGLGALRIVRIAERKDLASGLPVRIPATNYIEFIATADLDAAANAPGTVPNVDVPPNEFNVNPNSVPGLKAEYLRTGRSRTK